MTFSEIKIKLKSIPVIIEPYRYITNINIVIKALPIRLFFKSIKFDDIDIIPYSNKLYLYKAFFNKTYENQEIKLIKKHLNKDAIVLELGASIGVVSCITNKILMNKINQVSVEPNEELLRYINWNKKLNSLKFNVFNGIVSKEKSVEFHISENPLSSSIVKKSVNKNKKSKIVKTSTIVDLENQIKSKFNFLIMDIEGGEFDFLKNFEILQFKKIIIELHENKLSEKEYEYCLNKLSKNHSLIDQIDNCQVWSLN